MWKTLLIDIKESLERDINGLHKRFDEMRARFDAQAMRLDVPPQCCKPAAAGRIA